ncbi:MAG TPA: SpoIIE family protein phosphatase [Thermoanaerobaculia bacterium]|nr:SpoIIE family protein phosphatase [Thermoanaerobaculia bacterium]
MTSAALTASITLTPPNADPVTHALTTGTHTLGRGATCSFPIKDRFLSRHHAEITLVSDRWVLKDCGSANGTFVNGARVQTEVPLSPGDRITLGDTEIAFHGASAVSPPSDLSVHDSAPLTNISILFQQAVADDTQGYRKNDRLQILNALALELLEDRPLDELFDFIVERVHRLLRPSRAAIAILSEDKQSFVSVTVHKSSADETSQLTISRTLMREVVDGRRVISFVDVAENEKFQSAQSIIGQSIRSALCAPLIVGETVVGVLYLDYLLGRSNITEEEVRLVAQVARIAAMKLETTKLREEALTKHKMEAELRTAYVVQSRLLPSSPPVVEGYEFASLSRPCNTVSGDYYDFVVRPDGRVYFVIADVSGKGITAALVMAGLATAFGIFTRSNPTAADLVRDINLTLAPKTAPSKFVTLFAGILDPVSGEVQYANAGHVPPLHVTGDGVRQLAVTDMVVGLFVAANYRNQTLQLAPGESLLLFTDGVTECENAKGEELGGGGVLEFAAPLLGKSANSILLGLNSLVMNFAGLTPQGDDVTLVALSRR